jgi:hypothetical protein
MIATPRPIKAAIRAAAVLENLRVSMLISMVSWRLVPAEGLRQSDNCDHVNLSVVRNPCHVIQRR